MCWEQDCIQVVVCILGHPDSVDCNLGCDIVWDHGHLAPYLYFSQSSNVTPSLLAQVLIRTRMRKKNVLGPRIMLYAHAM